MEKNTMKWLNRRRLPKSVYALIRQAEAEKESTLCLLFAQQPNPAGRQQKKRRKRANVWMGCEAGVGIQMGSAEVTFLISPSTFYRLFRPCTLCSTTHPLPTHAQLTLCRLTPSSTHSVYGNPLEPPPPEGRDQGVSPPNMSPPPLILLCHHVLSESATKRTVKEKKWKKGGKKTID